MRVVGWDGPDITPFFFTIVFLHGVLFPRVVGCSSPLDPEYHSQNAFNQAQYCTMKRLLAWSNLGHVVVLAQPREMRVQLLDALLVRLEQFWPDALRLRELF